MIGITALTYQLPGRAPVTRARASERCDGYWYLTHPATDFCLPFESRDAQLTRERMLPYAPGPESTARLADAGVRAGDMAVGVASNLRSRLAPEAWKRIDVVLYCYTTTDAAVFSSIPARLQHELDLKTAFPLALTQADCCGFFTALLCAGAFIAGPSRARAVLIVAADKWLFPFVRAFGPHCTYGDGAAAVVVESPEALDSGRALMVDCVEFGMASMSSRPFGSEPVFHNEGWAAEVGGWLSGALAKAGVRASAIDMVAPPDLNAEFVQAVHRAAGLSGAPLARRDERLSGFASTVDPIVAVAAAGGGDGARRVLTWGAGLNGEAGLAVLRMAAGSAARDWHLDQPGGAGRG